MCDECEKLEGKLIDVVCDDCARMHGGSLNVDQSWYYWESCNICKERKSVSKAYRWNGLPWRTVKGIPTWEKDK